MKVTVWGLALILFGILGPEAQKARGATQDVGQTRIVGGVSAAKGEYPFIVSLYDKSFGHFCGGSLISAKYVLTAAHCVSGTSSVRVRTGLFTQGTLTNTETFVSKRIVVHPLYNQKLESDYDFALIELSGLSKYTPVILNNVEFSVPDIETQAPMVTVAGWGTTFEGGNVSKKLMKVKVPLVSQAKCEKAYPGKISDRMICAGFEKGGKDSCQGDSGGPLVYETAKGKRLIGVVSWGEGCARPNKYGIYGKVNAVTDWIKAETK